MNIQGAIPTFLMVSCSFVLLFLVETQAKDYYVSPLGNDTYRGTREEPWRSWQHAADRATPGDTVYFRGGIYRERVVIEPSGEPGNYITFRNYNEEKVHLWFSKRLSGPNAWKDQGNNRWFTADGSFGREVNYDVATIWHDGTSHWSYKKRDPAHLEKQWDFWHDLEAGRLEVYSTANPAMLAKSIEVPLDPNDMNQFVLTCRGSYIHFIGIHIKYCNVHGMQIAPGTHHVTFRHGAISHGGGGNVHPRMKPPVRWGDALDITRSAHEIYFEHSSFGEFPDGTLTNQGSWGHQHHLYFRNNTIHNSTNGIHCWLGRSGHEDKIKRLEHIYYEDNTFVNIGRGWFADRGVMQGGINIRPNRGVHTSDFYIRNNVFIRCGTTRYPGGPPKGVNAAINIGGGNITIENNRIYDGPSEGIHIGGYNQPFTGRVANNLIYNNGWSGIHVMANATDGSAEFYNNTLVNNGADESHPNLWIECHQADTWCNNIFVSSQLHATRIKGGDLDYNCYWPDAGPGTHSINLHPLFMSIDKNDYRLQGISPCIDAGHAQGAPCKDIQHHSRPWGRGIDIGAFEMRESNRFSKR